MKPFDDRPRPSAPAPKNAKKCFRCRTVFPFTQPKDGKPGHQYGYKSDDAGESICKETRACRSRVLGAQIGRELGQDEDWLFARTPRDRYAALMDVRPGKPTAGTYGKRKVMKPGEEWKQQGWLPAWELWERVEACIIYHSWCHPVYLDYAVQLAGTFPQPGREDLDPDGILRDSRNFYRPIPLKVGDIARILNEHQSAVSRALKRLRDTKRIRMDEDGVMYPCAKILAMSVAERRALYELGEPEQPGNAETYLGGLVSSRSLPREWRERFAQLDELLPEGDIRSDIFRVVAEGVTLHHATIRGSRSELRAVLREQFARAAAEVPELAQSVATMESTPPPLPEQTNTGANTATLYPECVQMASPTIEASSRTTGQPARSAPLHDVVGVSVDELYEHGSGRGAMAKVPTREERPGWLVAAKLAEILGESDDPGAARIAAECRKAAPSITDAEIAFFLARNAGRGKGKENPVGLYIRALPPLLKEDTLQRIREEMRLLDQADQVRATRDVETLQQRAYQAYRREYAESAFARMANDERAEARTAKRKALVAEVYFKRMAPDQQSRQVDLWIVKDLEETAMPFEEWKLRAEGQHA